MMKSMMLSRRAAYSLRHSSSRQQQHAPPRSCVRPAAARKDEQGSPSGERWRAI
jgi:hypothetical protein